MRSIRVLTAVVVVALAAQVVPAGTRAAELPLVDGLVTIAQGSITGSAQVTLQLAVPDDADGRVRISNDGLSWIERPWAATMTWSLVDPAAGGEDVDGVKQVTVEVGTGTTWDRRGIARIELDRVAPSLGEAIVRIDGRTWRGYTWYNDANAWTYTGARHSLDGSTWTSWQSHASSVDLFELDGLGPWTRTDRKLWMQVRDGAGNVSEPAIVATDLQAPAFTWPGSGPVPVTFETPRFPVAGELFTIRPVYPDGYVLPADAWCGWHLHWGDKDSVMGHPNPAWGEILFERPKSSGACAEWTFTLPATPARYFHWTFSVYRKDADEPWGGMATGLFASSNNDWQIFRAARGSTDPRFLSSNIPFAFLLPESTVTQKGDPVTYRLHVVGTTKVPQTGSFWTYPLNCYLNPSWSQRGGTTYTYTPNCDGPWVTGWTGTMYGSYMRSQYDPLVDGRAPKVSAPVVKLRSASFASRAPVTIAWSATDRGSGVYRYELQVSRNGRAWAAITLPSRLSTSVTRTMGTTGTYRFRVRAKDRVGNWSSWVAGPTVWARTIQETSASLAWSVGWTRVADRAFSGGAARRSTRPGATARLTTSARSIAWISRTGPGRGLAQVYVDGVLAKTVDLNAASLSGPRTVFSRSWRSTSRHVIRIKLLGTVGRPLVEADAFLVVR
jgi:hypothetical protein